MAEQLLREQLFPLEARPEYRTESTRGVCTCAGADRASEGVRLHLVRGTSECVCRAWEKNHWSG